jgi:hypothetical protein
MRLMIRIVSGFFLAAIGIGFFLEARNLDSILLKAVFLVPGFCSFGLGLFVLIREPKKRQ